MRNTVNERTLTVLEFPKILERLARHTSFSASRELARGLRPSVDLYEVARNQRLTTEARRLLDLRPNISVGGTREVRPAVQRATLGGCLESGDLLAIQDTLAASRVVRSGILRLAEELPSLTEVASLIVDCPLLEGEIGRCIGSQGDVLDSASPLLARIRSEQKIAHQRLLDKLSSTVNSSAYRQVIQESIITMREGRYVIPIKAEARGQFPGVIHDQSASGATLFVEPLFAVDLNNRWRQAQIEEQHEIDRILRELSAQVAADGPEVAGNVGALAEIDLALAKAKYAIELKAVEPVLASGEGNRTQERQLRMLNARHPLLGREVVPISVWLGSDFAVLVITGPNTGGKTVALKTLGLLTLMAQAGLHIPAAEGSQIRVFKGIYADIGDEQSIEQSLSTFSSHMTHIIDILGHADEQSLVLLDEIGAGTDPTEGSALARAILSCFLERGSWVAATTHYSELKAYAHETPGVQNASVEFNVETLSPTFRLSMGLPGRSNALAIAERLGLPQAIIDGARELVSPADSEVEGLLKSIQGERDRAVRERTEAQRERHEAARMRRELEARLRDIEAERQQLLASAAEQARVELEGFRERIRRTASALERAGTGREVVPTVLREARSIEREMLDRARTRTQRHIQPEESDEPRELRPGDIVHIRSLSQTGELLAILEERHQAEIQVGNFKLKASLDDLDRTRSRAPQPSLPPSYSTVVVAARPANLQLDMRGWRADQVVLELDRYLDDAYLAGLPFVRLLHGKGSGALRQVVREFLDGHSLVRSYQSAEPKEGGDGVTIAHLVE